MDSLNSNNEWSPLSSIKGAWTKRVSWELIKICHNSFCLCYPTPQCKHYREFFHTLHQCPWHKYWTSKSTMNTTRSLQCPLPWNRQKLTHAHAPDIPRYCFICCDFLRLSYLTLRCWTGLHASSQIFQKFIHSTFSFANLPQHHPFIILLPH